MFTLHSRAVPDLPAGHYVTHTDQTITAPGATPSQLDAHFEVTAPRFSLPPDQVLSTFPPNQSEGEFSARLPQIVLKRRTLPWERELDGKLGTSNLPREIPWLALVVLADAECEFKTSRPIAECVTPGVVLEGRNDTVVGNAIVVTDEVVRQIFPNKEELPLLAHVRNVDLSDTELALGDDDGWLAVLLSNRLPQPGMRYRACLISVEGQYGVLPDAGPIEDTDAMAFEHTSVYEDAATNVDTLSLTYGSLVDGAAGNVGMVNVGGGSQRRSAVSAARSRSVSDGWSTAASNGTGAKAYAEIASHPPMSTSKLVGAMHTVNMSVIAPNATQYTFPVLAHWQFTCKGSRDFQALMQNLDVGMMGTLPRPLPPTKPGQKPPPPPTRDEPEVVDTGHIALTEVSRAGEPNTIWYRGPLVPRPTTREQPDASGRLALLHASDQARRVGPDGRENLSLAAAFEIGRLLALAEPSVVAALLNWRKQALEQSRQRALLNLEPVLSVVGIDAVMSGFAIRAGLREIVRLGATDAAKLGAVIPTKDPGRAVPGVSDADLVHLLSTGLGVPVEVVRDVMNPGNNRVASISVPVASQLTDLNQIANNAEGELAPLRGAVLDTASGIAEEATGRTAPLTEARKRLDRVFLPEGRE
jgi:hypothetical protein